MADSIYKPPPIRPSTLDQSITQLDNEKDDYTLERIETGYRTIGILKLRGKTDNLPQSWWFASTAIPLIAATIGPLANVLSIAALVSKWRVELANGGQLPEGTDNSGVDIPDPQWEIICNAISLACGFIGNFFLLLNFTKRVRYILALPMTIIFWFLATGLLIGITACMYIYEPAVGPGQTYSQGYWHAVIAAVLYFIGCVTLMVNMLGYFMGKYPQHFDLDDDQRTLILQTMMFFFWLAGGAAVFQAVCDFSYSDALYFCDVTVLTVGFGDYVGTNDAGRGLVFPYSVIGIIFLGLMINSIRKFAISMSKDKVIKKHELNITMKTHGRTVSSERELRQRLGLPHSSHHEHHESPLVSSHDQDPRLQIKGRTITFIESAKPTPTPTIQSRRPDLSSTPSQTTPFRFRRPDKRHKLLLLREERDRFNTMRSIQAKTKRFRQYYALFLSVTAFGILWCIGALVFMYAEAREQNLTYFQALYFCYVSLLTIGYGDFSPKSNAGKAFFVIWSLIAIPTMTILVSDMGDTVVGVVERGTWTLADWTVMPRKGLWASILRRFPGLRTGLIRLQKHREGQKRLKEGFGLQDPDVEIGGGIGVGESNTSSSSAEEDIVPQTKALEELAEEKLDDHQLARKLALAIKRVAADLAVAKPKKYTYEEWLEFTRLIRFSARTKEEEGQVKSRERAEGEEEDIDEAVEWDWIGSDSPMLSEGGEAQWVLDRLCGSLGRYVRGQARAGTGIVGDDERVDKVRRRKAFNSDDDDDDDTESISDEQSSMENEKGGDSKHSSSKDEKDSIEPTTSLRHGRKRAKSDAVKAWEAEVEAERLEARNSKS